MATQTEIVPAQKRDSLMVALAAQYGIEPENFKSVLIRTVFPSDKPVTMEQLAAFCIVASKYKLNPILKEIYAFPQGGGIIPIVSVDGWISIVQRQENYSGHRFEYEWKEGNIGGEMLAAKCIIYRRDLDHPIEHTEFMDECAKETTVWKKWPRRMLTHRAFIQCARYAFGFSGIYDEEEAERILEAEREQQPAKPAVRQPQRTAAPVQAQATTSRAVEAQPTVEQIGQVHVDEQPEPHDEAPELAHGVSATAQANPEVQGLFDSGQVTTASKIPETKPGTIGPGRAKRLRAIINSHHKDTGVTEKKIFDDMLTRMGIEHLNEMPVQYYDMICDYATRGQVALDEVEAKAKGEGNGN